MDIFTLRFAILTILSVSLFYLLKQKDRIGFLTIISCLFIASFNYLLCLYVLIYSLINFYIGRKLSISDNKKTLFRTGLLFNIFQLVVLRYASFAIDPFFQLLGSNVQVSGLSKVIVPIGISYFTLQGTGYLINIKMGWEQSEKKFIHFLLYITFFPKYLSGPIERSNHFLPQINLTRPFDGNLITAGLRIILIGVFKKVAIANQLAPFVISAYTDHSSLDGYYLWLLFFLQPLYLYFDFSGYTDIAIGIAKMFGINLLPNFNRPFFSQNMTTFWKRFHISLSSWFNDYVFRQTSFKYRNWGVYASVFGLFITWALFGIWHGAGWNFMFLGLLQAIAIIYEFFTKKLRTNLFSGWNNFLRKWISRLITYSFYCVSLVFFFTPDIKHGFDYFARLTNFSRSFTFDGMSTIPYMLIIYIPIFFLLELVQEDYSGTSKNLNNFWQGSKKMSRYFRWGIYSIIITILFVIGLKNQQFIYANF